jgi:hypothetical protein
MSSLPAAFGRREDAVRPSDDKRDIVGERLQAGILGTASAALATQAFSANNYDSPDWEPIFTRPTVGREPRVSVYKEMVKGSLRRQAGSPFIR